MTDAELRAQLATLKEARASGILKIRYGEREITFRSDLELAGQIHAIESQLYPQRPRNVIVRPSFNKGW